MAITPFTARIYWDKGMDPFTVIKGMEKVFGQQLPVIASEANGIVAESALKRLRSIHLRAFLGGVSGTSYKSILNLRQKISEVLVLRKPVGVYTYRVGYYPGFFESAKSLAPKHGVYNYMGIMNAGARPGKIKGFGTAGVDRMRQWALSRKIAQDPRKVEVLRLRKRREGTVGRPTKFRRYSRMANSDQQLWAIAKKMGKRGIRGRHHLFAWASYIRAELPVELQRAVMDAYLKFYKLIGKYKMEVSPVTSKFVLRRTI